MKIERIPFFAREALPLGMAVVSIVASMFVSSAAQAASITVNSIADDVFINATGLTFSDAAYTVPVSPAYCTLRMAISSANRDAATGGCTAGSGNDNITFSVPANSTITLAQVAMDLAPFALVPPATLSWLLYSTGNVIITGPGSALLTVNGGGLGAGTIGLRTLVVSNNDGLVDAPATITGVSFKEGRNVGGGGGCVFSRESLALTDVRFEGCEAVGNAASTVGGGALAMGVTGVSDARPNATLSNVKFIGNRAVHGSAVAASTSCCGAATFGGGGLLMGSVTIADTQFIGNVAENHGALRIANGGSATITNTQFVTNAATTGSNGAFQITGMSGTVTLNGGGAIGNSAAARRGGGSIITVGSAVSSGDAISVSNWSFIGNAAGADIGGLDILTDTFDGSGACQYAQLKDVRLTNVYFERNFAKTSRGGFRIGCSGNAALSGVEMTLNEAGDTSPVGGGNGAGQIYDVGALTMDNIRMVGNKTLGGVITPPATQNGGYAVFTVNGPPFASPSLTYPLAHSFTGSRFLVKDNFATENEILSLRPNGAGRNYSLSDSSFVGNRAKGIPGLFLNATGNYAVTNSTFSGNVAIAGAGPLFLNTHADSGTNSFLLRGITIARNGPNANAISFGAFSPTGGATTSNATVAVSNAILGQFSFGNGVQPLFVPVLPNVTYTFTNSVVENGAGLPAGTCGANGVICNVDAKLEGLADNGGNPQTFTHALRPGSPALDAGSNTGAPEFDQRGAGFSRIVNGSVDIGAFESPTLATLLPCKLDMDGDNQVSATREGLVLLRSMLGFGAAAAVSGTGISQSQWDASRNNLNANCGTNFSP